jgi:hypothetical protein
MRRTVALIGASAMLLVLAAPVAAANGELHITSTTTLTEDQVGNIVIDASGITLDCAGHRVIGSGGPTGILLDGRTNVTVKNCQVSGFFDGIAFRTSPARHPTTRCSGTR